MSHPLTTCISEIGFLQERIHEKNARIEALEAALREIVTKYDWCKENWSDVIIPHLVGEAIRDARAALAPEQDK